jgi:serine/threonine protein kinase/TPR repeat protein
MAEPIRFQHYEVLRREDGSLYELGRGAMGITYKAFDTNLRTVVALKVINATYLNSDVARQRFLREARAAAAIRHPNVAAVFHLGQMGGEGGDGGSADAYFYAMEFIDGETVESFMQRHGAIPTLFALEIASQVSRALAAAEKQGLVHRDIKPSNLMLVRQDGDDEYTTKVIDFGLAKAADSESGHETATLTMGGFLGTPHFASPEQLEERVLDTRSDIYSLGVTLYYMLAGRTPFTGSLAQVMSQHLHREPPLELLSGQPREVIALLERMLAKDPADRPQSPADLRREIESCVASISASHTGASGGAAAQPENAETVADVPREPSAVDPAPGVILADRLKLLEEFGPGEFGKTFRAQDMETGETVAVLILDPDLLPTSEAFTRLENEVTAIQAIKHPTVIRVLSLERAHHFSFVTREWVEGPTLLDSLRKNGSLPIAEALDILSALAEGLEAVRRTGMPCPALNPHWITLASGAEGRPIPKFNALNFSAVAPANPDATLVEALRSRYSSMAGDADYVPALAALAYRMLGGVQTGGSPAETFVPIPGLSEEANRTLRRALNPGAVDPSPLAFSDALRDAARAPRTTAPPPTTFPTVAPSPEHRRPPIILIGVALCVGFMLLSLAGAAFFILPRLKAAFDAGERTASPTPAVTASLAPASPLPSTTPAPSATPEPSPAASPTPEPAPDALETGLKRVTDMALADDYEGALRLLAELHEKFPTESRVSEEMEKVAAKLEASLNNQPLSDDQLGHLESPLQTAALAGSTSAQMLLAKAYQQSKPAEAFKYYLLAADDANGRGNSAAMLELGNMFASGVGTDKSEESALEWFRKAAAKGEPGALYAVGEFYFFGRGGLKPDPKMAIYYLSQAAGYNNPHAQNLLGDIYRKGTGLDHKNFAEAYLLFSQASAAGFLDAQGNLGVMVANGEVPGHPEKDYAKAAELFRQGAEAGNALCMYFYAKVLEAGLGLPAADKEAARTWYIRAAHAGQQKAIERCNQEGWNFEQAP